MASLTYEELLQRGDCGIIFLKLSYPISRLRSVVTKAADYVYIGFYTFSCQLGPPNILVDLIDVFQGALTPSWYRATFTLEDLMNDKLTESIIVKPCKINTMVFRQAVMDLSSLLPRYSWEDLVRCAISGNFVTDSDVLLSFLEGLEETTPLRALKNFPPVTSIQELACESSVLEASYQLQFQRSRHADVVSETESALFIEKSTFQKLTSALLKLINEDATFRRDLAHQMLLPNEENLLQALYQNEIGEWHRLLRALDKSLLTGELKKGDLVTPLEAIRKHRATFPEISSEDPILHNLDYASQITFDEIKNTREMSLSYLHQLISSLSSDCRNGASLVTIPINDLIVACNRACHGTNLPIIQEVAPGSYSALLVTAGAGEPKLETFDLAGSSFHLIPSQNADLNPLSTEQLQELNQLLNKKKPGRIVNEYFHGLREKVALLLAQRSKEQ